MYANMEGTISGTKILLLVSQIEPRGFLVYLFVCLFVCLMLYNVTFINISVISWQSVLLVKETGGLGENHRLVASH